MGVKTVLLAILLAISLGSVWAANTGTAAVAQHKRRALPSPSPSPAPQLSKEQRAVAAVGGTVTFIVLIAIGFCLYWLPAIVAFSRHHHNRAAIAVLNLLLGWTVAGWIAALIWSFTSPASVVMARGAARDL